MNNPRVTKKEWSLIKGALRRVFSRSELRKSALDKCAINHKDPNRPRVTKWNFCPECGIIYPRYLSQVDHVNPVIPLNKTMHDLTLEELLDNLWCAISNLNPLCPDCHEDKTAIENKERAKWRKIRKAKK